jgi:hypothetical protein
MVFAEGRKPGDGKKTLALLSSPEEEDVPGVVSWPGEYNELGVSIRGIGQKEGQQVSYLIDTDDARILCVSQPLEDWPQHDIETAGDADVLVAPVTDSKFLQKLIDEIDPRVLILLPAKGGTDSIMKALGAKGDTVKEYKLKGLPADVREVVVLD